MDEEMVCRLKALAREKWPKDYKSKPKLRLVGVNDLAPANEPPRRVLRPTEARKLYGWPGEGMKTGSDG
ncbi:hypothetical protein [Frateuria terrea]|uniref:Uncharacterized protein n=1 Tax=Frateuria terrea TaxID=529704 RepID=A0A1H6ZR18_9GAMM|nr:hypothetical protein [Frateuria terrea]SEJ55126.1 hypothetical protein SAMN04487997_0185 [Frateuria terrea]SFP47405.1 hypothetical protein SAMN02927913_2205 [Frateuria terrea]